MATENHDEDRPLHLLIPVTLHERLRRMAKARDRSVSAETRQAIEARLAEFESEHEKADRPLQAA